MSTMRRSRASGIFGLVIAVGLLLLAGFVYFNQQMVVDRVSVWQYDPPAEIAQLATDASMSESGRYHFYIGQPSLESTQAFNTQCDRREPQSAILGCYAAGKIYVFNVDNEQLAGIEEVTAAHEMLHVAYERLDQQEKDRLAPLLEAEFDKVVDDRLVERMAYYERNQPGERINELHSIIGTEVADISNELESYYEAYFTDRSIVTTLHADYESVFNQLSTRVDELSARLETLGRRVETMSLSYNNNARQLNTDIETFNQRASAGEFESQQEFNTARSTLLAQVASLDAQRDAINQDIADYEAIAAELETLALESAALNQSLDSSLAPAPQL